MIMVKGNKVDLTLLKKLVGELESHLNTAGGIQEAEGDIHEYIIEMSRAAGVAAGVMAEAGLVIGDIHHSVRALSVTPGKSDKDFLEKLLGGLTGLKGPGNTN
jgi:hypothetical protein